MADRISEQSLYSLGTEGAGRCDKWQSGHLCVLVSSCFFYRPVYPQLSSLNYTLKEEKLRQLTFHKISRDTLEVAHSLRVTFLTSITCISIGVPSLCVPLFIACLNLQRSSCILTKLEPIPEAIVVVVIV